MTLRTVSAAPRKGCCDSLGLPPSLVYNRGMTPKTLEAVYERGVLRPLEALDLPEHKRVQVTISEVTRSTTEAVANCYDLAAKAGLIGALRDGPSDLSTNPEHFRGFGSA